MFKTVNKLEELEIKNKKLAESNNIYQVELEIKEEIIEKMKSKFSKIYAELIHRREIENKHHLSFVDSRENLTMA